MKEAGVTLLELLVTLAILMILASVAMPLTRVSAKRAQEIEMRQQLRVIRAAIDLFKIEWNREGDVSLGMLCTKNKLTCKEVSGVYGHPKSLDVLLGVTLSSQEAVERGTTVRRYLRKIPIDPMTGKAEWLLRCYSDPSDASRWCGSDVYDLSTQSQELALDGTKYRDW
ncbi:MAG TPA: prepilin-type N-terminal cleavage/methylation domain-containing protein [Nitrospiraceae bacterium]|nr:prepilin-type N-terminal cleavage/methylation domain-containing protein [Nitrospiraceae bacterium]